METLSDGPKGNKPPSSLPLTRSRGANLLRNQLDGPPDVRAGRLGPSLVSERVVLTSPQGTRVGGPRAQCTHRSSCSLFLSILWPSSSSSPFPSIAPCIPVWSPTTVLPTPPSLSLILFPVPYPPSPRFSVPLGPPSVHSSSPFLDLSAPLCPLLCLCLSFSLLSHSFSYSCLLPIPNHLLGALSLQPSNTGLWFGSVPHSLPPTRLLSPFPSTWDPGAQPHLQAAC